jgi:hypothetical protein
MILPLVIGATLAAVVVGLIGAALFRRRREDPWHNAELFIPHDEPVPLGGQIVARHRCRPRTPGGADGAVTVAELRCEEVVGGEPEGEPVGRVPIEIVDHSTPDLVEADLVVRIPAWGFPASVRTGAASIRWVIAVRVDAADGTHVDVERVLRVAARVTV